MVSVSFAKLHKTIFYLILVLLPTNLGKHFISVDSYVNSRLVDYLVPTFWLIDILLFGLFITWAFSGGFKKIKRFEYKQVFLIFILAFFPSIILAPRLTSALYFYLTFVLRLFLVVYIWFEVKLEKELKNFILIFSFQVVFLVILGLMQWQKQSSVFDNYLFFGEQVYDSTTFNVARTTINGEQRIPAYATFRHPNIFGGYLSIFFIWALYFLTTQPYLTTNLVENNTVKKNWQHKFPINIKMGFIYLVLIMAFVGTITTFSQFAILAVLLGSIFYFVIKYFGKSGVFASLLVTFFVFISSFLLTHLTYLGDFGKSFLLNPSIYRRVNLEISAYQMIVQNPVWGVGLNNFTVNLSNYLPLSQVLTFNQPVHNTFLLIFAESGVFVLLAFFAILFLCFRSLLAQGFGFPVVLFINLLQIIILGSFDHYFYTIPQTQILFLLTVGLSLTYTYTNAKV